MIQQQSPLVSDDPYLQEGDWIQFQFENLFLFSEGFKSADVNMKASNQNPLLSLFIIQHAHQSNKINKKSIHFNQPIVLIHRLSSKYLSYIPNFANKSQFKLRGTLTDHCQFILKPLYKCQTIRGNLVRNKEECALSPAAAQYVVENINLVVAKFEKNTITKIPIFLKKNQHSALRIIRKNLLNKNNQQVSNLMIYQIGHFQLKKWLCCLKNQELSKLNVTLNPGSGGYGNLLMIQLHNDNSNEQVKINNKDYVSFKFLGVKRYIGFNQIGNMVFSEEKIYQTSFQIELYSNKSFDTNSLMKIKHTKTNKYLSFHNNIPVLQNFTTFNLFQLNSLSPQNIKANLFINQVYHALLRQFNDINNSRRKRVISSILKEVIKFIYKNKNIYDQFIGLQPIKMHLNQQQQSLFAEIGFIDLLKNISVHFFDEYQKAIISKIQQRKQNSQQNISNQYNEDQYIYFQACLILTGICKNHHQNIVLFSQTIQIYFQHVGKIKANIQLLYHIFAFNSSGLSVLQSLKFITKKQQMKGVQFFCQYLFKKDFSIQSRIKLVKFFHGCLIDQNNQKMHCHQQIMLQMVHENRLNNIMFNLSNNQDYDLIISLKEGKEELSIMIEREDKYERQLELLFEQINLLTTLCSRTSKRHFYLFRDTISQEMLKKYLKMKLIPRFKSLFLRVLINVYLNKNLNVNSHSLIVITNPKKKGFDQTAPFRKLSNLSALTNSLLKPAQEVQMQQVNDNQFKYMINMSNLTQIKQLIKNIINLKLEKGEIGSEIIFCLYAFSNFLEVGVCAENEGQQVLGQLGKFLSRIYREKKELNMELAEKFLEILEHNVEQKMKIKINLLFLKVRQSYKQGEQKIKYSRRITNICNQYIQKELNIINPLFFNLLQNIIAYSASIKSCPIFFRSSKLYHKLSKISYYFLQMVKISIPIESDDSHFTLRKINKIYNALSDVTVDYIYYHDNTMEIETLRKNISYIVTEAIELLQNIEEDQPINMLSQKIMGEFNFFDIVIQLIYQRQKDLLYPHSDDLFQLLFKFIAMFLFNSEENLLKNINSLQKLSVVYNYQDKGQLRLLWALTQMEVVAVRMNKFLFDCWISATRSATRPNIHIPLGLLKLIQKNEVDQNNDENIIALIKCILADKSILDSLFKISTDKQILLGGLMKSKQQWIFYLTLVIRLLLIILDNSKQSKISLLDCYRKYFSLKVLIKMIEQSFALEFDTNLDKQGDNLLLLMSLKFIKIELIKMFIELYLTIQDTQFQYLVYLIQRIFMRLTIKNTQSIPSDYIYKHFMFYNKLSESIQNVYLRQGMMSYLKIENQHIFQITPEIFHPYVSNIYLFINSYYNFIFKMYENMIESNESRQANYTTVGMKQLEILIDNAFNKYRQLIQDKLTYSEYVGYWNAYSNSIKFCEQIINKKVGLTFNYQASDDPGALIEGQEYFCHREIQYIFKSFLHKKVKLQRYLYQAMLIMIYNSQIQHLKTPEKNPFNNIKDLIDLIVIKMKTDHSDFQQKCKLLCRFISLNRSIPEWQPSLQCSQIVGEIISNSEDQTLCNLKFYVYTQYKLLQNYYQFQQNQFKRYNPIQFNHSQSFSLNFTKIKQKIRNLIQIQVRLHDKKMLIEQSKVYFQSKLVNYQIYPTNLNIQLILQWLLYKVKYNIHNIDRYYDLILEVVTLLKTYVRFIHQYDSKYITSELYKKIEICLKILFRSVTGNNVRMLMLLIQQEIWSQINLLLSLNDSLQQNLQQIDLKTYDLIKKLTRVKLQGLPTTYLQGVLQLYNNSMGIYGQNGQIVGIERYPLIPIKAFYHDIKYLVAILIKEFKHLPNNIAVQFYSKIDTKYIDYNIVNSYQKFQYMYGKYSIATIYPSLNYEGKKQMVVAKSIGIANGIELAGIRMHMDSLNGRYQLVNKFSQYRMSVNKFQKIQSFFSNIKYFFIDLVMLFIGIFYSSNRKSLKKSDFSTAIFFFLNKLSHIQLIFHDKIYQQDFMIYPECILTIQLRKKFLNKLNFISNQLKRESILLQIQRSVLNYQNELTFFKNFNKLKLMLYMARYIEILKLISYIIVIANNIILMMNQISVTGQTLMFSTPFQILTTINLVDSLLILLIYIIKDMPFVLKIQKYNLTQGIGFFGRKFNEKSPFKQALVLTLMVITNRRLLYNLIYAVVVGLIFYNPIFASVLLLDVLAHVPSLKTLLLAIWRPKYHLILTLIAYIILQYFFSIFMYFLFKDQASPYCDHLGSCFAFIFITTFKAVHGFVGYLFQEKQLQTLSTSLNLSPFLLFQNLYVVMIYQIVIALILAIVIDSFTVARTQKLKQMDYLTSACIVCNIERSKFNIETKLGFKGHVSINHNLFSYIDFKYSVTVKPFDYLSDFQLAVLGDKTTSWIPDNKTMEFEKQSLSLNNKTID